MPPELAADDFIMKKTVSTLGLFALSLIGMGIVCPLPAQTIYVPGGTAGVGTSGNGNVGVGTSSPQAALDVRGVMAVNGGFLYAGEHGNLLSGALDIGDANRNYGGALDGTRIPQDCCSRHWIIPKLQSMTPALA
jgi:hypothetical protein